MPLDLYASQQGAENTADVILLHGLFGMGSNLQGIARALTDDLRIHSLDLRNHGRSPRAASMQFEEMACDVQHYMDTQGLTSVYLIGHSLGGKVAMQLALQAPHRIKGLVVADMAPVRYDGNHDSVFKGVKAVDLPRLHSRKAAEETLNQHIKDQGTRQFLIKNLYKDDQGRFQWRMAIDNLQQRYDDMRQGLSSDKPYEGPVLFIKGELSSYILPEHRDVVMRLFPKADIKIIQNTGHWLHAEKPTVFNRLVQRFLQRLEN